MTFIFPQTEANGTITVENGIVKPHFSTTGGMTLRDWFAGQALSCLNIEDGDNYITQRAYEIADAMITARKL